MIKLTKNEKKTLKLLIKDAQITDSSIALKLKISSQAVGKIRKKLESGIIESYQLKLKYSYLGINLFAISHCRLTNEGLNLGELEIEEIIKKNPNIIEIYRLPNSNITHILILGFSDINEFDNFFHLKKNQESIHKYLETITIFNFSNHSIIKNDPTNLYLNKLDETPIAENHSTFNEIVKFKEKIS